MRLLGALGEGDDLAVDAHLGQDHPEELALGQPLGEVGDDQLDAHGPAAPAQHGEGLRERPGVDDDAPAPLRVEPARAGTPAPGTDVTDHPIDPVEELA